MGEAGSGRRWEDMEGASVASPHQACFSLCPPGPQAPWHHCNCICLTLPCAATPLDSPGTLSPSAPLLPVGSSPGLSWALAHCPPLGLSQVALPLKPVPTPCAVGNRRSGVNTLAVTPGPPAPVRAWRAGLRPHGWDQPLHPPVPWWGGLPFPALSCPSAPRDPRHPAPSVSPGS